MNITPELDTNAEIYTEVVQNFCDFMRDLEIEDNPIKIFTAYVYMLERGFLSYQHQFSSELSPAFTWLDRNEYIPMDMEGSVILGKYGVCRHTADFLNYVYSSLGYQSSQLFVYRPRFECFRLNLGKGSQPSQFQEMVEQIFSQYDSYIPQEDIADKINHTVNVVRSKNKKCIHILDSSSVGVGEKDTFHRLLFQDFIGISHVDQYATNISFDTYFHSNYHLAKTLIRSYPTNQEQDFSSMVEFYHQCSNYLMDLEWFYMANKGLYQEVSENYQKVYRRESKKENR